MDLLAWFLLLAYTVYDWWTVGTWWVPWVFAGFTVLYGVWLFRSVCRRMATIYLERLIQKLRDRSVSPATGDEVAGVLAECLLSPTGRELALTLASAGAEPGTVAYTPEAMSVLTAFVEAKRPGDEDIELDANTIRWLKGTSWRARSRARRGVVP